MDFVLQLLPDNIFIGIALSLSLNIIISVAGLVPSTFLTAANIMYFGFQFGLFISIVGEALGAIISFLLYKHGIKALEEKFSNLANNHFLKRLKNAEGKEAIVLVFILRILPFIPSGLVTLAASLSKMKIIHFILASTIGKIPALFIEAYSIYRFLAWKVQYQVGTTIVVLCFIGIYYFWKKRRKACNE